MKKLFEKDHIFQILLNAATILIVAVMLLASRALAAPGGAPASPSLSMDVLAYQGTLVDAGGDPVDGAREMTFRIYNHPTEEGALWAEAHTESNAVPVQNGLFNVTLGSLTPIPDSVWIEDALYLGIQIGSDPEMSPREAIHLLPPRIESGSLDADALKPATMGHEPFASYRFSFGNADSDIVFENTLTGAVTTLTPGDCPVNDAWCCNGEDTVCVRRNPGGEDVLGVRMEESHSLRCWLVHDDDDQPGKSTGISTATDGGTGLGDVWSPFYHDSGNGFFFMREGENDLPLGTYTNYWVLCLE
jgi:hypothetical protein